MELGNDGAHAEVAAKVKETRGAFRQMNARDQACGSQKRTARGGEERKTGG